MDFRFTGEQESFRREVREFLQHNLPEEVVEAIKKYYENKWCDRALRYAFHQRDAQLAENARRRRGRLTFAEWLRYLGAKNLMVHHLLKMLTYCHKRCLSRDVDRWR